MTDVPPPEHSAATDRYHRILAVLRRHGLMVYGGIHPERVPVPGVANGTLLLIGTASTFWDKFSAAPEGPDTSPDPIDRYSTRVLTALAEQLQAINVYFPFGEPPYAPFVAWALASGRAFTSPSQMLVHDEVGMLISYRGALHFDEIFALPTPRYARSPCETCVARPCLSTCPTHALVDAGPYKLAACHDHLDTPQGAECMASGCIARRACPLSAGAGRPTAQNTHHMRYFHRP